MENGIEKGSIGEIPDDNEIPRKRKKGLRKKDKIVLGVIVAAIALVFIFLISMVFPDNRNGEKGAPALTKDLAAQNEKLKRDQVKEEKSITQLNDKTFSAADTSPLMEETEKKENLLNFLNEARDGAEEQVLQGSGRSGREESQGLSQRLFEASPAVPSRSIYGNIEDNDARTKIEAREKDYKEDKQTLFAYSTTYSKASVFDSGESETNVGNPAQKAENEFEGLTEKQIEEKLTKQMAAGDAGTSQAPAEKLSKASKALPTPIIYNNLEAVKVFEGQFIDTVLLNKLVCDTEESPVVVAVSKDMFDQSGRYVVIPTGTRVIGSSQVISYQGAGRLFVWFHRMILPNGASVYFPASSSNALDKQGSLGIVSGVNRHFMQKFGAAIFVGLLSGLGGLAQANLENSQWAYAIDQTQGNMDNVANQIISSYSNIVPTIKVNAGHQVKVYISSDIVISAFALIQQRSYARK